MSPTTERPRIFRVLRTDGKEVRFCADTICDVNGYGTYFRFKRAGKVTGEAQGDMHAWWLDDGAAGKTWNLEIAGHSLAIVADSKERIAESRPYERFERSAKSWR